MRWVGHATDFIGDYFDAVDENRRLKKEVAQLEAVRDNAIALQNINRRYEALLNIRTQPPVPMVAADLVSKSRGPFANAQLIDAGTNKSVRVGNPVINEYGLVGRVMGVSPTASRVLMLTDVASRTPVLVDRSDARAILVGDGGPNPRLDFLRGTDSVKDGDRIMTSGDGGMLPRGLAVGVAARALDGTWRVKLYAGNTDTDVVRVLLFDDFSQLLKPDSINAPPLAGMGTAPQPAPDLVAKIEAAHPDHPPAPPAAAPSIAPAQPVPVPTPPAKSAPAPVATATDVVTKKKSKDASQDTADADKAAAPKVAAHKPAAKKKPTVKADVIPRRPVPYTAIPQ